ncbi:hypothetical protein HDU97_004330 [Phlyctochytrium planicorne]|nr:hypothetical protein HDU97_004330 [Phlyctochytrium planicorne]
MERILRFIDEDRDEDVVKLAGELLDKDDGDVDAFLLKVVGLIKVDRFQEALDTIAAATDELRDEALYEKAYAHYRLHQHSECASALKEAKAKNSRSDLSHLELQLVHQLATFPGMYAHIFLAIKLYRQEKFLDAKPVAEEIVAALDKDDPYTSEVLTNLNALNVFLSSVGQDVQLPSLNIAETYETAYNRACTYIAQGDLLNAEKWLEVSKKRCTDILRADGCSDDVIAKELTIIVTQLAYVYQQLGRTKEAEDLFLSILAEKPSDNAVVAVASNNLVALKGNHDLFDSVKRYRATLSRGLDQKLLSKQKAIIALNGCVLSLLMKKFSASKEQVKKLLEEYPADESLLVMQAGISLREKGGISKAIQDISQFISQHKDSVVLHLALAELYLRNGQVDDAVQSLERFLRESPKSFSFKPAIVSVLAGIYKHATLVDKAVGLVSEATLFWRDNESEGYRKILRDAAFFKISCCHFEDAARDLEVLVRKDSSDVEALAGLVIASSQFDINKAKEYSSHLPSKSLLFGKVAIDVDQLESAPPMKRFTKKKEEKNEDEIMREKVTKKRKRKPRTDKVFDPNVKPDPERWLPKYERSAFKKKAGKKDLNRGPQGASVAGGGLGGTGSANIAGRTLAQTQAQDADVEMKDAASNIQEIKETASTSHKKKKNKKK